MTLFTTWINAFRPRTLPLAAASIIVAGGLAQYYQVFNLGVFALSLLTALLLQVLSNLANDYGDAISGADTKERVGPQRAMQTGLISKQSMLKAIIVVTLLSLLTGLILLYVAFNDDLTHWLFFLLLGVVAIIAAITYTMGKVPYGYRAMGDLAVFIFFGLTGVLGCFYLQSLTLPVAIVLPAVSVGLLSAAVLNINNMRDYYNDKLANKITLVVLLGRQSAFYYHLLLVSTALICATLFITLLPNTEFWQYLFLLVASPLIKSCMQLKQQVDKDSRDGEVFNLQLKNTAMSTFVFALLFSIVLIA